MNHIGHPTQFLHGLEYTARIKYGTLGIVCVLRSVLIGAHLSFVKIIIVVDEIDLNASGLNGSHFDDERVIGLIDDDVHSRQANHFVQLVTALVDIAPFRHKRADLVSTFLNALRQLATDRGHLRLGNVRYHFLRDVQNLLCFHPEN